MFLAPIKITPQYFLDDSLCKEVASNLLADLFLAIVPESIALCGLVISKYLLNE